MHHVVAARGKKQIGVWLAGMQGPEPYVVQALPRFKFPAVSEVIFFTNEDMPKADYPAALAACLQLITAHQRRFSPAPGEEKWVLWVDDWHWTAASARQLAVATAAALPQARLRVQAGLLDDSFLQLLMKHGTGIKEVKAEGMQVQSDHSGSVCGWDTFTYNNFGLAGLPLTDLLRLPRAAGGQLTVCFTDRSAGLSVELYMPSSGPKESN